MGDNFKIILETIIDQSSLTKAQKEIAKQHFAASLDVELDLDEFAKQKNELNKNISAMAEQIKLAFSKIKIDIDDKQATVFAKEFLNNINQAAKAQDSLTNAMAKGREQIEAARKAEEQRQQAAQNKAINKALEEEWKERQKNIEASKKQAEADKLAQKAEVYDEVYKSLDKLYALKKEYAKLGMPDSRESELLKARIKEEEELLRRKKTATTETDNWDASKQRAMADKEIALQKELQAIYEQTAQKAKSIKFSVDSGNGSSEYQNRIEKLKQDLEKYGISAEEASQKTAKLRTMLDGFRDTNGNWLPDEQIIAQADKIEQEFKAVKVSVDQTKLSFDKFNQPASQEKVTTLINKINTFLTKNTAITQEAKTKLQGYVSELERGVNLSRWNEINSKLKETENSMRGLGRLGASLTNQFKQAGESFAQWLSVSSAIMFGVQKTREAVKELKELDNILTEISKTSDLTTAQLKKLGDTAFDTASKYGKKASDYLTGVQEMYRAGFDNAEQMAELSVLAQSAGDMDATAANNYLMATNAAYKYKGSIEDLNEVLDGQNYITNNAAISMKDISDATSETASVAAQYGVHIDELSALIATATANTRESGSEVGTALKAIMINLQDTTSKPVTETFDALGISMTKVVDGAERLKTPIELIYELADAYNSLPEGDVMRANILNEIGQKRHANTLASILSDMEGFESMLDLYNNSSADGSAFREAEKSANNLQGSLNRLSNTWVDTVENIADSDLLKGTVNTLNWLLTGVNNLTDALGSFGSIGTIAGIALNKKLG